MRALTWHLRESAGAANVLSAARYDRARAARARVNFQQAPAHVSAEADSITVATVDHDVHLPRLETLDGKSPTQFLRAGQRFDVLDDSTAARLTAANATVCTHENFWLRRLETQTPLELPYIDRSAAPAPESFQHLDVALPPGASADVKLAALVAYLARLSDKEGFELGFAPRNAAAAARCRRFAQQVLLRASVDFSRGFDSARCGSSRSGRRRRRVVARPIDVDRLVPWRHQRPRVKPVALASSRRRECGRAAERTPIALAADGSAARWLFDAAKLDRATVLAMQEQAAALAKAAEADAHRPLAELPLWGEAERSRVLAAWNATDAPVRDEACMHRLFEEQAARTPSRTAVTCEGDSLSYAELDQRANQLARRLKSLGVGPDVLVGLCVERSVLDVGLMPSTRRVAPKCRRPDYRRTARYMRKIEGDGALTQERLRGTCPHRAS